jgi:hypothetical protein
MVMWRRIWLNLFTGWLQLSRWFPESRMKFIRDIIAEGEKGHVGELCFAVEARYSLWALFDGIQTRQRAEQVFSSLGVWNTQDNSGVLVYLQLAERRIEIIADRGIAARVPAILWQQLCAEFAQDLHSRSPDMAVVECLSKINVLLQTHFPARRDNIQELPDEPIIL